MIFKEMVREELIFVQKNFKKNSDVIKFLSEELREKTFVKKSFCDAVLEREKKYPTGLYLGKINVAIPHADIKYVNKPGMAVATLQKPISFRKMDDPTLSIPVHIVFLLVVKDPKNYLNFLSVLTKSFNNEYLLQRIYNENNSKKVIKELKNVLFLKKGEVKTKK
jgi:PTS system galactitol-specific IIA component